MDRPRYGGVGLALLLALPTLALAGTGSASRAEHATNPIMKKAALAERTHVEERAAARI